MSRELDQFERKVKQLAVAFPDDAKTTRVINGVTYDGHPEALDAFETAFRKSKERKASMSWENIQEALNRVADCLRKHDTGSTAQLKRFVWSLWNGHHQVNLYNLGRVLDDDNSDAVATIFTAYMRGILTEDHLRLVLVNSGEMARWDREEKNTERDGVVDYPCTPTSVLEHCRKLDRANKP